MTDWSIAIKIAESWYEWIQSQTNFPKGYTITPFTIKHYCNGYIIAKTFIPISKDQPNIYCLKCLKYIDTSNASGKSQIVLIYDLKERKKRRKF